MEAQRAGTNHPLRPQFYSATLSQPKGTPYLGAPDYSDAARIRISPEIAQDRYVADLEEARMIAEAEIEDREAAVQAAAEAAHAVQELDGDNVRVSYSVGIGYPGYPGFTTVAPRPHEISSLRRQQQQRPPPQQQPRRRPLPFAYSSVTPVHPQQQFTVNRGPTTGGSYSYATFGR